MIHLDYAAIREKPSSKVISAIHNFVDKIGEYPDESYVELKLKLATSLRIEGDQIVLGNGCDEIIDLISRAFLKPNDKVFIPSPTFSQFELAAVRVQAIPILVNCMYDTEYSINNSKISNQNHDFKLIWLCSPNNPTGTKISTSVIEDIVAANTNSIVAVDEALKNFENESAISLIGKYPNLIVLKSFSKSYCLAGLRLGVAFSNRENIHIIESKKQIFNVNLIAVAAAMAALDDSTYYSALWDKISTEKKRVAAIIKALDIPIISNESNFLLLDFITRGRSEMIYNYLLNRNVKVFPGWDPEFSGLDGRFLRVVIGSRNDNDIFLHLLSRALVNLP